jgi:hypothetical protein
MSKISLLVIIAIFFSSCSKEKELLKGDIIGKITLFDQNFNASADNSGVQIALYSDSTFLAGITTDMRGFYRFEDINYGKYRIDILKENYIKPENLYTFNHVGGYSPTIYDGSLHKIPDYLLTIDSLKVLSPDNEILVFLKVNNDTIIPFSYYSLIGYYGNNAEVSKDNYSGIVTGIVSGWVMTSPYKAPAIIYDFYENFPSETFYIRFYLLAHGQSIYKSINKSALGKPSNVISFTFQK